MRRAKWASEVSERSADLATLGTRVTTGVRRPIRSSESIPYLYRSSRHETAASLSQGMDAISTPARLLIVAPHPVVWIGLRSLLARLPFISILGEASVTDGRWQDLNLTRHTVDIVVTDATSSLATHLEFITALQSSDAPPKFIVIIDGNNPRAIEKLIEIKVQAILTPDDVSESLVSAVQQVAAGSCFVSYNTLSENVRRSTRGFCSRDMGEPLTLDELRIMRLVADGLTNREIAEREFMSEPTVKRRTQEIYRKLGARDRAHAAALAARLDIL